MRRRALQNALLIGVCLLFIGSSVWGLMLQQKHERLVDYFYRGSHWNIHQLLLDSQRFLYELKLYRGGVGSMEALSLEYDLFWNRIDIFLVSEETRVVRGQLGLAEIANELFDELKSIEPQMDAGTLVEGPELDRLQRRLGAASKRLEQVSRVVLTGEEREASVTEIRRNMLLLQVWQLTLLVAGVLLVGALVRANMLNRRQARTDPLTRLGNRLALHEQLDLSLGRGGLVALVILDLKRFKQVNDQLGYQVGDRLLQVVADKLTRWPHGHAFRLGGDEFACVIEDCPDAHACRSRAEELLALLAFDFRTRESSFQLRCRLGLALTEEGDTRDSLIDHTILALNQAKGGQQGDLVQFSLAMLGQLQQRHQQVWRLQRWLEQGSVMPLAIHLEPMVAAHHSPLAMRLTLSWHNGESCPLTWLEESGLLEEVMAHVLAQAYTMTPLPLLLGMSKTQLARLLRSTLIHLASGRIIVGLPFLAKEDPELKALVLRADLMLALEEVGSATMSLARGGWPLVYWTPCRTSEEEAAALQPLVQALGLTTLWPARLREVTRPASGLQA
ncbi:diguanylate cyclase domain-containing protein [Aeromonas bivalvium]|uniref:GGDEF domain-containing protein n=1 Tax=Aeromonas bivalvium TaxID=440079 RepID=UPI000DD0D55E|nr:GGDEF domain-containing protein [Aeromonas bivalvium]